MELRRWTSAKNRRRMVLMFGASASDLRVHARTAVLLVRDEALREALSTIIGGLTRFLVVAVDSIDDARAAVRDTPDALLVVAPAWGDRGVAALLQDANAAPTIVVSASQEHASLPSTVFVRAPFDVDTLLDAIELALDGARRSQTQRIA